MANLSEISLEQQTDSQASKPNVAVIEHERTDWRFLKQIRFHRTHFTWSISRRSGRSGSPSTHQAD
jgi:hypothetical protein